MIIKGRSRGRSQQLAIHLLRQDQNESIRVHEMRGTLAGDVSEALEEMEARGVAANSRRPLYHASVSPEAHTPLTDRQIRTAVDMLEEGLGFNGQPRIVVVHQKGLREHVHVVWSRVDVEQSRAIPDSWNYRVHEEVARSLEVLFGHRPIPRSDSKRHTPAGPRAPRDYELRQEERSGRPTAGITAEITALWHASNDAESFRATLEKAGYRLARGDRRVLVVIDRDGEVHSLARRVNGVNAKDLRQRFRDTELKALPSVSEVRENLRVEASLARPRHNFERAAGEVTHRRAPVRSAPRATPRASQPVKATREAFLEVANFAALSQSPKPMRVPFYIPSPRGSTRYRSLFAIVVAHYAAKMANARTYTVRHELSAVIAALLAERAATLRAIIETQRPALATRTRGEGRAMRRGRSRRLVARKRRKMHRDGSNLDDHHHLGRP